jgi:hypothetical protein
MTLDKKNPHPFTLIQKYCEICDNHDQVRLIEEDYWYCKHCNFKKFLDLNDDYSDIEIMRNSLIKIMKILHNVSYSGNINLSYMYHLLGKITKITQISLEKYGNSTTSEST